MKNSTPKRKASKAAPRSTAEARLEFVPLPLKVQRILVPVDFSQTSLQALQYAVGLSEQFGGRLTLVHVIEPVATPDFAYYPLMMEPEKAIKAAQAQLEALSLQKTMPHGVVEKTLVRHGVPYVEITDAARTLKMDLIVITTHGYTGLKHVFLGSTAERIVRHAPCPVLTVREKEHE